MSTRRILILLVSLAAGAALLAAGCGGSDEDVSLADPGLAEYAPPDPPLYVEAVVKPEGDLKADLEEFLGRFPDGDRVGEMLKESLNEDLAEDGLTYEEDIEPWLGDRGVIFVPSANDDVGVGVVQVTDEDAAAETLRGTVKQPQEREVAGVTVVTGRSSEGEPVAFSVADGVAVLGNDEAVVVETVERGQNASESFASNGEYARFVGDTEDSLVVGGRADVEGLLRLAETTGDAEREDLEAFRGVAGGLTEEPVLFAATATADTAAIEFSAAAGSAGGAAGEDTDLISSIPQEAWAAIAVPGLGESIGDLIETAGNAGSGLGPVRAQLRSQLGIELSDFSALGDAAIFAAGTSIFELQVGAVFEVTDQAAADRLLDAARRTLGRRPDVSVSPSSIPGADGFTARPEGLPVPINFVTADNRLVIAAGDQVTQQVLEGQGGFDQSEVRGQAADALGDEFAVNAVVDFGPILELVDSTGQGGAEFDQARPYLGALDLLAIGSATIGERDVTRIVVTTSD